MSEETFEQLLNASFKTIHTGEVVEGTVIDVKPDEIILNIGYKSDGILTKNEYSNDNSIDLTTVVKVGDTMDVKVLKTNDADGQVILSYKRLAIDRGNKRIEEAFNNKEVLTAKVVQVLEGGLTVVVDEVRIFIPASLVSDSYEKDLSKYQDQLGLIDCKQKTIEMYLGIERKSNYDSKTLIPIYNSYKKAVARKPLEILFLHNYEDVKGMFSLLPMLQFLKFFS